MHRPIVQATHSLNSCLQHMTAVKCTFLGLASACAKRADARTPPPHRTHKCVRAHMTTCHACTHTHTRQHKHTPTETNYALLKLPIIKTSQKTVIQPVVVVVVVVVVAVVAHTHIRACLHARACTHVHTYTFSRSHTYTHAHVHAGRRTRTSG